MQRHEMIQALGQLGLKGMAGAFDDAVTTGLQRNRTASPICSRPRLPIARPPGSDTA